MDAWMLLFLLLVVPTLFYYKCYFTKRKRLRPKNLVVFISGCDSGIGQKLAQELTGLGCEVWAGCLQPTLAKKQLPQSVKILELDITKESSVIRAVTLLEEELRTLGKELWAVVNNAGVCVFGEFEWQTWKQIQQQVDVNILGTIRLIQTCLPLLRKSRGRIITVTSINGSIAYPGLSAYCATKFALEGLCHSLRVELGRRYGIKVITVQPGDYAKVTSIMATHEKNVQEMWDAMSPQDKKRQDEYFHRYHQSTLKNYGLSSPTTFEGSAILSDLQDALLNFNPAARYVSAPILYKAFYALLELSPYKLKDMFFKCIVDFLYGRV